jgi:hypothetical protein
MTVRLTVTGKATSSEWEGVKRLTSTAPSLILKLSRGRIEFVARA